MNSASQTQRPMRTRRAAATLLLCVAWAGLRCAGCEDVGSGVDESLPAWHPRRFSHRPPRPTLSMPPAAEQAAPEGVEAAGTGVAAAAQPPPAAQAAPAADAVAAPGEGRWEDCEVCEQCVLGEPPTSLRLEPPADKHCKKCYGCSVVLSRLPSHDNVMGKNRVVFTGASGAAVFRGETAAAGAVVVKFWCGLPGEYRQNDRANPIPECAPMPRAGCKEKGGLVGQSDCNFRFLNSMQKMVDEANLTAVTPRTWTEHAKSFLPYDGAPADAPWRGLRIDVRGQFYERADGVSIEAFLGGFMTDEALKLLLSINSESVRLAAAFDFIFSESDRHGQNVILHPSGRMQLIDNEGAGQVGVNSMFLPGTQKYEIYRIGYPSVCCANMPGLFEVNCPGTIGPSSPEALLDYRCHVPGGAFGKALPPGMASFVSRVAAMSAEEVVAEYDMIRPEHAARLKARVDDIAAHGFEAALQRQLERQPDGNGMTYGHNWHYKVPRPCCSVAACPFRLARDYVGALRTEAYGTTVPWIDDEYNAKVPAGMTFVGGPADPPFNVKGGGVEE